MPSMHQSNMLGSQRHWHGAERKTGAASCEGNPKRTGGGELLVRMPCLSSRDPSEPNRANKRWTAGGPIAHDSKRSPGSRAQSTVETTTSNRFPRRVERNN